MVDEMLKNIGEVKFRPAIGDRKFRPEVIKSNIEIKPMDPEERAIFKRIQTVLDEVRSDRTKIFQLGENLHRAIGIPEEKIEEAKKAVGEALDQWAKSLGAEKIEPKTREALINEVLLLVWLTM